MASTDNTPHRLPDDYHRKPLELPDVLGTCWPSEGPLARALEWAAGTTDAEIKFHIAALLPVWAHECSIRQFTPCHDQGFRVFTFIYGQPASSKSTAVRRAQSLYNEYRAGTADEQLGGWINANGTESGLFATIAGKMTFELGFAPGILYHEEASAILTQDRIVEFFCQVCDGITIERHQRSIQAANAARVDSIPSMLRDHVMSMTLATTFRGIRTVVERVPGLFDGGLGTRALHFLGAQLPRHQARYNVDKGGRRKVVGIWHDWRSWALAQTLVNETPGTYHSAIETTIPNALLTLRDDMLFSGLTSERDAIVMATRKRGLTQAVMLAQLFALNGQSLQVREQDMVQACHLVQMSTIDFARLLPRANASNPLSAPAVEALERIASEGRLGLLRSKLYPLLRLPKRQIDEIVDTLEDAGEILVEPRASEGRRGRPPVFLVATEHTLNDVPAKDL